MDAQLLCSTAEKVDDKYRKRLEKKYAIDFDEENAVKVSDWKKVYHYVKKYGWSRYLKDCDDEVMMMLAANVPADYPKNIEAFYKQLSAKGYYAFVLKEIDNCYNSQLTKEFVTMVLKYGDDKMFDTLLNSSDVDSYIYTMLSFAMESTRLDLTRKVLEKLKVLDKEKLLRLCPECLADITRYRNSFVRLGFKDAVYVLKCTKYCLKGEYNHCLSDVKLDYYSQQNINYPRQEMFSSACLNGSVDVVRLFLEYIDVDMRAPVPTHQSFVQSVYNRYRRCQDTEKQNGYIVIFSILLSQFKTHFNVSEDELKLYESIPGIIGG